MQSCCLFVFLLKHFSGTMAQDSSEVLTNEAARRALLCRTATCLGVTCTKPTWEELTSRTLPWSWCWRPCTWRRPYADTSLTGENWHVVSEWTHGLFHVNARKAKCLPSWYLTALQTLCAPSLEQGPTTDDPRQLLLPLVSAAIYWNSHCFTWDVGGKGPYK